MSGGGGGNCKLDQAVNSDDKWARVKIKSVSNKVNKVSILILKYICADCSSVAAALAFSVDAALLERDIALCNSVEMYKYGNFVWNKMKMKNISPRRLRMNVTEGNMKFKCLVQSVHGIWI